MLSVAMLCSAQQQPTPTPAMQAIIDKDTSRHFGDAPADAGPLATDLSPALTPEAIDKVTRKVADWQLGRSTPYWDQIWTSSVMYAGFMAVSDSTGDPKYRDAMQKMAEGFHYGFRNKLPNADDQSIAQAYLELYLQGHKQNKAILDSTREALDSVIDLPTLRPGDERIPWWWCDSLFMAPPVWVRMYAATGDHKYIDYMNAQWARSYAILWDKDERLYARDQSYFGKPGPNGKKIFWSRGEGWVMGGLARTLEYLPKDDPQRAFYIENLRVMAARLAELQDKDGLWHASLLDAEHFPAPEVSGSALIVFGMAYGVNKGYLDAATYRPVIERAWQAMVREHIYADGRLGDIQQTGAEPAYYLPASSFNYGVGGFLLAAAELRTMVSPHVTADIVANVDAAEYAKAHLSLPANPKLKTVFVVGDSTVRNGNGDGKNGQMGWGDELAQFLDTNRVNVVNRAIGGRSSRTYISEGHWAETLKLVKPGDVILVQFGHNDAGPLDDRDRARGSINGVGDEAKEIYNPLRHVRETVYSFGHYLDQYVKEGEARDATVILCSLVPRKTWKDGHIERQTETYRGWTEAVATRDHAGFIDLNEIVARRYEAMGKDAVEGMFGDPHTHTTAAGATLNAESVVSGLKALAKDPLANDFSAKGKAVAAFKK